MPADDVPVRWEVAERRRLRRPRAATAWPSPRPAGRTRCTSTSTGCDPAGWYSYRFVVGDQVSPVGRTRTAPRPAAVRQHAVPVRQLPELAVGLLAAVGPRPERRARRRAAPRRLHLRGRHQRQRRPPPQQRRDPRPGRVPEPLRALQGRPGAAGGPRRLPVDRHLGRPRGREQLRRPRRRRTPAEVPDFAARRAAAYQAWWEHMPVRTWRPHRPRPDDLPLVRLGHAHPVPRRSTPASTATRQACGGSLGPDLPRPHRARAARCSAPTRRRGSARASRRPPPRGTCSPTRSS